MPIQVYFIIGAVCALIVIFAQRQQRKRSSRADDAGSNDKQE
jgi:hypothetical protein